MRLPRTSGFNLQPGLEKPRVCVEASNTLSISIKVEDVGRRKLKLVLKLNRAPFLLSDTFPVYLAYPFPKRPLSGSRVVYYRRRCIKTDSRSPAEIVLRPTGAPLNAKTIHAALIVSASCCGGSVPRSGSVPFPSVSNTNAISSAWQAPRHPLNCGERQANSYI